MRSMPDLTLFISGTDTGVGKTWIAAHAAGALRRRGLSVAARKPVQSFSPGDGLTDAEILAAATGEDPLAVCQSGRWLPRAMAPPMAADVLGRPRISINALVAELDLPARGVAVIEGAGGPRTPLAHDGDNIALAAAISPDLVILVADAGLGAINAVRLATGAFLGHRAIVVLNRFRQSSDVHRLNRKWLQQDGHEVDVSFEGVARRAAAVLGAKNHPIPSERKANART